MQDGFHDNCWTWHGVSHDVDQLFIHPEHPDIGGGKIRREEIDRIQEFPEARAVSIMGLRQDTFEYFVERYGSQFAVISFFKNKLVEDWSALGGLPDLECVHYFHNQRIKRFWDMSANRMLRGICINDFSRLKTLSGIETAPDLRFLHIGDAIWPGAQIDSLNYLAGSNLEILEFSGKSIAELDMELLFRLPKLRRFDFPTNLLTTEQIAWIAANFPHIEGYALRPWLEYHYIDSDKNKVYMTNVCGKRKPCFPSLGNEAKREKFAEKFAALTEQLRGLPYSAAKK